jgi:tellurite resistance protein TehA-like permease
MADIKKVIPGAFLLALSATYFPSLLRPGAAHWLRIAGNSLALGSIFSLTFFLQEQLLKSFDLMPDKKKDGSAYFLVFCTMISSLSITLDCASIMNIIIEDMEPIVTILFSIVGAIGAEHCIYS